MLNPIYTQTILAAFLRWSLLRFSFVVDRIISRVAVLASQAAIATGRVSSVRPSVRW